MTREQKVAKAKRLRAQGLRYREIGEAFDVSAVTAYRWVNPERTAPYRNGRACNPERTRQLDREYDARHRTKCSRCGGDRPRQTTGPICAACIAGEVEQRARQIEGWWKEGLPMREIADRLRWSSGHLKVEMHRLREAGYDLPYRYTHRSRSPRFPRQVAA